MMATILVVEDDLIFIEFVVELLRDEGYEMLIAHDGVAALETLAETGTAIDLVITDTMLPRLDGVTLIRSMRELPVLRDIPVIVMSGAARPDLDGLGTVGFLPKPFDLTALLEMVAATVDPPPPAGLEQRR